MLVCPLATQSATPNGQNPRPIRGTFAARSRFLPPPYRQREVSFAIAAETPPFETIERLLRDFAERRLGAEPGQEGFADRFRIASCSACDATLLQLDVQRTEGDRPGDFHGNVWMECVRCGDEDLLLSVIQRGTPEVRDRGERLACACGGTRFHVAILERWETWGFFDEGAVVARCVACGQLLAVVDMD